MSTALYIVGALLALAFALWHLPTVVRWGVWWTAIAAHAGRTKQRCAWCAYVDLDAPRDEEQPFKKLCTRLNRRIGPFDHCALHLCKSDCLFCEVRKANA